MAERRKCLRVRLSGDPILHNRTKPVTESKIRSPKIQKLISTLFRQVSLTRGAGGFAANQIGVPLQVCVVKWRKTKLVLVNPVILRRCEETNLAYEGCASIPGYRVVIERPNWIIVSFHDEEGVRRRNKLRGVVARLAEHEIDHLQGRTILDKVGYPGEYFIHEKEFRRLLSKKRKT